jgi:uncharacterized membrane protein
VALFGVEQRGRTLIIALIALYILVFSVFTIGRYERYNATGWDLGIFTQLVWNASQGRFLQNTIAEQNNMLGIHSPYITILLGPLFWLWADPRMLLITQSVILGLGAWPIARLASRHFKEWWIPPLFAAFWMLYPSLGWINRWDFHEIAPAATFLAFAFEAADRRAWRQTDLWLVLAILCKEEIGLNVAFFGLYMGWRLKRHWRAPAVWFVLGLAWFFVHAFVIFPILRHAENGLPIHATRYYSWLLSGDLPAMWAYITGPDAVLKIEFLVKIFLPVAFVALLAPGPLLIAVPTLALDLLSSWQAQFDIYLHYTAPIIPAILCASIYGAVRLRAYLDARSSPGLPITTSVMSVTALLMWIIYNPLFTTPTIPGQRINGWEPGAHVDALNEVAAMIPADACVVTANNIQDHYSVRPETYVIGARGDMDGCAYMIVDLGDPRYNDFTDDNMVACSQFWSKKRVPIYFRDTVVVLKWSPAEAKPEAWQSMQDFCTQFADQQAKHN